MKATAILAVALMTLLPARGDAPANDLFDSPIPLDGLPVSVSGNNTDGTMQSGEPTPTPAAGASVWYRWTAPATGYVEVDTSGSAFDTVLAVWSGDSLATLVQIAQNDNSSVGVQSSKLGFGAFSGVTYRIAVYGISPNSGAFNLNLKPAAGIAGTVTSLQGGAPLGDIDVTAYRNQGTVENPDWQPVSTHKTRSDGSYVLGGFEAGVYRVGFNDFSNNYLAQYHGSQPDVASAADVTVMTGVTTSGINAALELTPRITGIVRGPDNEPLQGIDIYLYEYANEQWDWRTYFDTGADGRYTCLLPAPGTYRIGFVDPSGIYRTEFHANQSDVNSASDIHVAGAATVSGIDATLELNTRITGTVTGPDGLTPLAGIQVTAYWRGQDGNLGFWDPVAEAVSGENGSYSLINLPSGSHTYIVGFSDPLGRYAAEYHEDAATESAATQIQVPANTVVHQIDASLTEDTTATGRVKFLL